MAEIIDMTPEVKVLNQSHGKNWTVYHGDSCEVIKAIPNNSLHYSWFSPPFAAMYCYSASDRDMGNSTDYEQFWTHFKFLIAELSRAMMPGRIVSVHNMNIPTTKQHHGVIGIEDFRGEIIREFEKSGVFVFHSEATIWKDPVTAMQRTKALGLLHKQVTKDSCRSRMGIPDSILNFAKGCVSDDIQGDSATVLMRMLAEYFPQFVVSFRKQGDNPEPVSGEFDHFAGMKNTFRPEGRLSIDIWQKYASPIWDDIDHGNTLQYTHARENLDERHVCPANLDVIERCLQLWTNPGDVVYDPFGGIGTTGYQAVRMGRKSISQELKASYYEWNVKNHKRAESESSQPTLFGEEY